ncbi:MAG: hypothetical protein JW915_02920 [Chitinispirillaceae bacterium]|nr:hypothetical protein [Chitinispirillaceae bacterium]
MAITTINIYVKGLSMNLKVSFIPAVSVSVILLSIAAAAAPAPEVSFSGYLDADGWADFTGKYYTNTELDLGLTAKFSDAVSAHVYVTANGVYSKSGAGSIPAGSGVPDERWLTMNFDGFDITWASPYGTFAVGDIVYQYGTFNYYFYKRKSMITMESFSRGVKYSIGNEKFTQDIQAGIADIDQHTADVNGKSMITISETQNAGLFYGIRGSSLSGFKEGSDFFAGLEYNGSFGDKLALKIDIGYNSIAGEERTNLTTILLEPSLSFGKFTVAATAFIGLDDVDSVNVTADHLGIGDEMFYYVEPGYSVNDHFGIGLPLEYHDPNSDIEKDGAFWIVPTFYIYPIENVQWWIWGQVVKYTDENTDNAYGFGSEIIVTF